MIERLLELDIQSEPVSPVCEDTVAACLAKEPAERPPSVGAVLQLLERTEVTRLASLASQSEPDESAEEIEPAATEMPSDVEATPLPMELPPVGETRPHWKPARLVGVLSVLAVAGLAVTLWFARDWIRSVIPPAAGLPDKSINIGRGADDGIRCLAVQPDGKILIGGGFEAINGMVRYGVARLNADGSLDKNFNNSEGASGYVWSVAMQPDGKVLAAGAFDSFGGTPCGKLVRLLK